mmetsp:Transcript_142422/g.442867  ORF Transcript_142422/g.442867 Transcript_142422/m.442867 type:complete len:252 (+) Transcript_142422:260-1015(+)
MLWEADVDHPVLTWPVSARIDDDESFTVFAFPSAGAPKNCQVWDPVLEYFRRSVWALLMAALPQATATGCAVFGLAAWASYGKAGWSVATRLLLGALVGALLGGCYVALASSNNYNELVRWYHAGSTPSEIVALDAATGKRRWKHTLMVWSRPTAKGDQEGYAQKIATQPWRAMCCPVAYSSPSVDGNGVVYIGHMSGKIFGVKDWDKNGRISDDEVYEFDAEGAFLHSGPAFAPGVFAFTTCEQLFVFRF